MSHANALFTYGSTIFIFLSTFSTVGLLDTSTLWTTQRVQLLMTRLTDNYESNRTMAFSLLAGLPQDRLGLQVGQQEMTDVKEIWTMPQRISVASFADIAAKYSYHKEVPPILIGFENICEPFGRLFPLCMAKPTYCWQNQIHFEVGFFGLNSIFSNRFSNQKKRKQPNCQNVYVLCC